jgi:predicted nucleic acid-binding protein
MVIVDSSVWIDFFCDVLNRETVWLNQAILRQDVGLTSLILCEVLQGVRTEKQFREFGRDLQQFPVFDTGSKELAIASARNFRILRQKGITIRKTIDCIIATFCIEQGHELLHRDSDFSGFEEHLGLNVIHTEWN